MLNILTEGGLAPSLARYLHESNWIAAGQVALLAVLVYLLLERTLRGLGWLEPALAADESVVSGLFDSLSQICAALGLLLTFPAWWPIWFRASAARWCWPWAPVPSATAAGSSVRWAAWPIGGGTSGRWRSRLPRRRRPRPRRLRPTVTSGRRANRRERGLCHASACRRNETRG